MPAAAFLAPFLALFLGTSLRAIVFRVMAMLGLGLVTFTGSQVIVDQLVSIWLSYANDMPSQWLSILGYMNVDRAFSLIASALAVKISIQAARKSISIRSGN